MEQKFPFGKDEGGRYSWTQTKEDVEVRVLKGIPEGKTAKRRIVVSYDGGLSLIVKVDGEIVLKLLSLYDRVTPDECSWTVEKGELVVTLEKVTHYSWVELTLPETSGED